MRRDHLGNLVTKMTVVLPKRRTGEKREKCYGVSTDGSGLGILWYALSTRRR